MSPFQNRAISASAGTGKTFRLAHRYLGLMAAGVAPDRICALTFSRKAAGEVFDKIVDHLCAAASDGSKRAQTAETIAREGFHAPPDRPAAYVELLRALLDNAHRLRIGTLDSFILGVVRAFPMELGIPPETRPVDGDGGEAQTVRQAILTRLFDPTTRQTQGKDGGRDAFLTEFRQACFGQETKKLAAVLDTLISGCHGFYRQHSTDEWRWGDPDRIWPRAERWWACADGQATPIPDDLPDRLGAAFGPDGNPRLFGDSCARIAQAAMAHAAEKPWPKIGDIAFLRLLSSARQRSAPSIPYKGRDYQIPPDLWPHLRRALGNLVNVEVKRALEKTRGLRTVLERYDALYAEALGRDGRFTFEDLSRLLGVDGVTPSRTADASNRLYIDYRLDGKLDHWLLDEFQDTSDTQWATLANLIDEVVQDENRSFFYVGDVKQSVYGWRGGNHRLFQKVLDQYRDSGPRAIASESMARCHRSLPAIITAVNAVFDGLAGWHPEAGAEKGPRKEAVDAFSGVWQRHESARSGEGEGYATLLEYASKKGSGRAGSDEDADENDAPAEFEAAAKILEHAQPTRNGLSTAVLVRSNKAGRACVDVLRRRLPDVPVVHEGKGGITDNPVVTLLLALVRYSAHPGDSVALRHLQMSPLADHPDVRDPDALPGVVLSALHTGGVAGTLRVWAGRLGGLDAFGRQRLRELLAAAEQFDAAGICDPDAFADHIEAYQVKASATAGTVRVMTIHQAKGLGFDLVIVPFDAQARSFEKPDDSDLLAGEGWVLDPPGGQALEAADGAPVLAREAARADANFAQLCVLYVAMTRAQQALYMLIPAKGKTAQTVREADVLRERLPRTGETGAGPGDLAQLFAVGDSAWFKARRAASAPAAPAILPVSVGVTYAEAITRREPSKEEIEGRDFPAKRLFDREAGDVRLFGSAIHRLFQKIVWIEEAAIEHIIRTWRGESSEPAAVLDDVERQFRGCVARDEVRRLLSWPAGAPLAEVWREAPFDCVRTRLGGREIVSGRFDRLVVVRDRPDRPTCATVVDFKSSRVADAPDVIAAAAAGYRTQMRDYAAIAARLLNLPAGAVKATLVFTRPARVFPLL